jgi:hypothetical protein
MITALKPSLPAAQDTRLLGGLRVVLQCDGMGVVLSLKVPQALTMD